MERFGELIPDPVERPEEAAFGSEPDILYFDARDEAVFDGASGELCIGSGDHTPCDKRIPRSVPKYHHPIDQNLANLRYRSTI